ncbi:hypothetical protein PoB_000131600 [Plakobranchus ocellatus]|uniref:Uncharacterized protein n=1 Tax=Plakobranchus ocellatus TaxID=259542 RepID=A0AAV3WYJ8_9GAST|nr:hypothetical protein PoB_000131600 [Plakobranchus ocellatus]
MSTLAVLLDVYSVHGTAFQRMKLFIISLKTANPVLSPCINTATFETLWRGYNGTKNWSTNGNKMSRVSREVMVEPSDEVTEAFHLKESAACTQSLAIPLQILTITPSVSPGGRRIAIDPS